MSTNESTFLWPKKSGESAVTTCDRIYKNFCADPWKTLWPPAHSRATPESPGYDINHCHGEAIPSDEVFGFTFLRGNLPRLKYLVRDYCFPKGNEDFDMQYMPIIAILRVGTWNLVNFCRNTFSWNLSRLPSSFWVFPCFWLFFFTMNKGWQTRRC